jgi:hypothetical protein
MFWHHQAQCDCGKNEDARFWVHFLGDDGAADEVLIVCSGCGSAYPVGVTRRREASRAEPVEGPEGRV